MNNKLFLGIIFAFAFLQCVMGQARIIGGRDADIENHPFIVSIYEKNGTDFICGGSIIRADWILTAAHCVNTPNDLKIRVGSSKLLEGDLFDVDRAVKHELYNKKTIVNDIAMLHIKNNLKFSKSVKSIRLAELHAPLPPNGSNVLVIGWGIAKVGDTSVSNKLQSTTLPYLNIDECKEIYAFRREVKAPMFCLHSREKCVCHGDSGGPAIYEKFLIGVTSWHFDCRFPEYPSVFQSVAQHRTWIDNVMKKHS